MKTPYEIFVEHDGEMQEETKCNKHKGFFCPINCDIGLMNAYYKSHIRSTVLAVLRAELAQIPEDEPFDEQYQMAYKFIEGQNQERRARRQNLQTTIDNIEKL